VANALIEHHQGPAGASRQRDERVASMPAGANTSNPLLWPLIAAASASDAAASYFSALAAGFMGKDGRRATGEPAWTTPNRIALELATVRLRDFSSAREGTATLVCAPFALHGATIVDLAPGHSLVDSLRAGGVRRLFLTDWRSADDGMRDLAIDNYLADLNVLVDALGAPIDLVGLCQGGWLALVYAARFPGKVRRLVLAGAPIDLRAAPSAISLLAERTPLSVFRDLVRLGGGCVRGDQVLDLWASVAPAEEPTVTLQLMPDTDASSQHELEARFQEWHACTLDLPGNYYLQVVSWLFKENRLAEGRFVALGRIIDLADVRIPVFLLAGRDDDVVSTAQLFATRRLIATPPHAVETVIAPCGHLSLFIGRQTLAHAWRKAALWLCRDPL
jgi:poly(3-hydroxyalkanoate) synthetase